MGKDETTRPDETRTRLLQAAERILLEQGVHALTVRHVGHVSGLNGTLVTYHFGGVRSLLSELAHRNLALMAADWSVLPGHGMTLDEILTAWLHPLLRPAAFNPQGRALIVLDEIAAHGAAELSEDVMAHMVATGQTVQQALAPHLPHLDEQTLRARLRFIAGAALGPPPRLPESGASLGDLASFDQFFAFARAALTQ
ncbi:AcrR family transcriptional regulator [Sphingobium xanthum]|jgi:AcrR family transcriptional regulator|uniref:TetR family transcriptional regulator n=1 Tax=Sphingobium xanthum TaxID=1387165 RepID=UPI001C8BB905|nr:TetR family transcriptional regulator [Sphingobium xanthum]